MRFIFKRLLITSLVLIVILCIISVLHILFSPPPVWYMRSRVAKGVVLIQPLERAIEQYYRGHNKFPIDDSVVKFAIPSDFKGTGISRVIIDTVGNGVMPKARITIIYDKSVEKGKTLILSTIAPEKGEKFVWDCKGGTLSIAHRIPECWP